MDEHLSLHELLIGPVRAALHTKDLFWYAWVIPGLGLATVLVLVYARVVLSLPPAIRNLVVLSAALFLGGAIGMEMLGGAYVAHGGSRDSLVYLLYVAVEETMEMLGTSTFIYTMLRYCTEYFGAIQLRLGR